MKLIYITTPKTDDKGNTNTFTRLLSARLNVTESYESSWAQSSIVVHAVSYLNKEAFDTGKGYNQEQVVTLTPDNSTVDFNGTLEVFTPDNMAMELSVMFGGTVADVVVENTLPEA